MAINGSIIDSIPASKTAVETTSPPTMHPRASFLGMPPELRAMVYTELFELYLTLEHWLYMELYEIFYRDHLPQSEDPEILKPLGILRTNRQIHQEASKVMFSNCETTVYIASAQEPAGLRFLCPYAKICEMRSWRFIHTLELFVEVQGGLQTKNRVLNRVRKFATYAIENGKYLKDLRIVFTTDEGKYLSGWIGDAMRALKVLRVRGNVCVEIERGGECHKNAKCRALMEHIQT